MQNSFNDAALQPSTGAVDYTVSFKKTGNEYQPGSNVVGTGADGGKLRLNGAAAHDNLVTLGVASCVAVIAVNRRTAEAGLWHLYHHQSAEGITREMIPTLAKNFDPAATDIYLVGGKHGLSERLVQDIPSCLAAAGFAVTGAVLYPSERLDIAIYKDGGIYVAPENVPAYHFYKPGLAAGQHVKEPTTDTAIRTATAPKPAA